MSGRDRERVLWWQYFFAAQGTPNGWLSGLADPQFEAYLPVALDELVATVTTRVLAEDAGGPVSQTCECGRTLSVQPIWVYPHAQLDKMGDAVNAYVVSVREIDDDDDD